MVRSRIPSNPRGILPPHAAGAPLEFDFEGQPVRGYAHETVAEALWAAGIRRLSRSPKYHRPRGAFCFAGQCGTCLVRVDGRPNVRACQQLVLPHMVCERQNAFPDADVDVLRAADWLFPQGMDHHHLMTGTKVGNALFVRLVREMGGTGTLPDHPDAQFGPAKHAVFDVVVVGAGPAGMAVSLAIAKHCPQARVLLIDQQRQAGGSWLAEPDGAAIAQSREAALRAHGVELWLQSTVLGHYAEDPPQPFAGCAPGLLAVLRPDHVAMVAARRLVCTTGAYEQNLPFARNDQPGVVAARACGRLVFGQRLLMAPTATLVFDPDARFDYADRLQAGLVALGVEVSQVEMSQAHNVRPGQNKVVAVAATPAPAFELPRQLGVPVSMHSDRGGFCAQALADGSTLVPSVFVAGDVCGYIGPHNAETHGRAVGRTVGLSLDKR